MIGVSLRLLALADQPRRLVAVEARHQHVEQDDRELLLEQEAQRLLAGLRADDLARCPSSTSLIASRLRSSSSTTRTRAAPAPAAACSTGEASRLALASIRRLNGFCIAGLMWQARVPFPWRLRPSRAGARHPDPEQRQQKVEIDRLGDVVGRAGLEALLAIALHRLGGHRDQRNVGDRRPAADLAHRLVAVHLRHHDVDQRDVDVGCLLEHARCRPRPRSACSTSMS